MRRSHDRVACAQQPRARRVRRSRPRRQRATRRRSTKRAGVTSVCSTKTRAKCRGLIAQRAARASTVKSRCRLLGSHSSNASMALRSVVGRVRNAAGRSKASRVRSSGAARRARAHARLGGVGGVTWAWLTAPSMEERFETSAPWTRPSAEPATEAGRTEPRDRREGATAARRSGDRGLSRAILQDRAGRVRRRRPLPRDPRARAPKAREEVPVARALRLSRAAGVAVSRGAAPRAVAPRASVRRRERRAARGDLSALRRSYRPREQLGPRRQLGRAYRREASREP